MTLDIDDAENSFYQTILDAVGSHISKSKKRNKLSEPWLDSSLRYLRNRRNNLHKILQKEPNISDEIKNECNELANEFRLKSREVYAIDVNFIGKNIIQNPKKFCNFVNIKREAHGYPKQMTYKVRSSSLLEEFCDFFADNFQSVYSLPNTSPHVDNTNAVFETAHQEILVSVDDIIQGESH